MEEEGGGVQTMDSRPAGGRGRKNSTLSQSSDSGALGTSGVGRLSLQHLNGRRHSNHSQVSQRSLDSGQDSLVGGVGVVHIRSRSQPASGGTEEEDGEEDDKGSGMLSVRTGSKHTSGSDNSEAVSVPPSSTVERHGSLLSLSRRSLTTKELTDSAYSSGMSTRPLEMSIATPTRSALIRKGSGGILEARGDACADEPVIEWSVSHGGGGAGSFGGRGVMGGLGSFGGRGVMGGLGHLGGGESWGGWSFGGRGVMGGWSFGGRGVMGGWSFGGRGVMGGLVIWVEGSHGGGGGGGWISFSPLPKWPFIRSCTLSSICS